MKTLYDKNYFEEKNIGESSAFAFLIVIFLGFLFYFREEISLVFFIISSTIWVGFVFIVKNDWEAFMTFFKIFFLKKENMYSKDMIFHFLDNIDQKYFPNETYGKEKKVEIGVNQKTEELDLFNL